jgi:hypothetical protein
VRRTGYSTPKNCGVVAGMKESQHEPLHHDESDKQHPLCQPEAHCNSRSRLFGKVMIAACLRTALDAAAGAVLPRLFSTKENAARCCAFPSNCAGASLSRTVLVQMLLSVEMKVPLQKSATSVRRNLVIAFVYLKMLDSNDKSRYTKIHGVQQRAGGHSHQTTPGVLASKESGDRRFDDEARCPSPELRGCGCHYYRLDRMARLHRAATRAQLLTWSNDTQLRRASAQGGAGTSTEHASKRGLQKGQMKIVSVPVWGQSQQL